MNTVTMEQAIERACEEVWTEDGVHIIGLREAMEEVWLAALFQQPQPAQVPLNFDNVLGSILSLIGPNTSSDDELLIRRAWDKARVAMLAPSTAEKREPAELPGMWDESDLIGGETE